MNDGELFVLLSRNMLEILRVVTVRQEMEPVGGYLGMTVLQFVDDRLIDPHD